MERDPRFSCAACAMERWDLPADPGIVDETLVNKGSPAAQQPDGIKALTATYCWPMQSHASIGPSCAIADVRGDAAADAAILSRAVGRPVRVQWTREDELGWDPKGPPQLITISGAVAPDGRILDWRTELWIPKA